LNIIKYNNIVKYNVLSRVMAKVGEGRRGR